jgi:hypothetical protein
MLPDFRKRVAVLMFTGIARFSCSNSASYMKMSMEHWWNDTDRGHLKYWEKNLFNGHFVYDRS